LVWLYRLKAVFCKSFLASVPWVDHFFRTTSLISGWELSLTFVVVWLSGVAEYELLKSTRQRNLSSTELIRFFTMLAFFISFFVSIGATAIYFSFSNSILFPFLNSSLTFISLIGSSINSSFCYSFIKRDFCCMAISLRIYLSYTVWGSSL
jgi:hypothetical protein